MRKIFATILASIMTLFGAVTLTGCSEITEILDLAFENEMLIEENAQLEEENSALKDKLSDLFAENATLRFYNTYTDGVVGGDAVIELNNVTLEVKEGSGDAITVTDSAVVTINEGTYNGGQTPFGGAGNTAAWVNSADAKLIINGGYFYIKGLAVNDAGEKDSGHVDLIYCSAGTIEINGGYFEGADSDVWLLNCKDATYKDGTASIIVKGGTFANFDPSNCLSEGENTNFVAEGYVVVKQNINGVDYYTVVKAEN